MVTQTRQARSPRRRRRCRISPKTYGLVLNVPRPVPFWGCTFSVEQIACQDRRAARCGLTGATRLMRCDGAKEYLTEILELRGADTIDRRKGIQIARAAGGHVGQGTVGKNNISRYLALPG